jgi:hypothetical protein
MEMTHHKKALQREDSSSLSSRHPVPTLTPLPLCSGMSKCLSMGEEVGTMNKMRKKSKLLAPVREKQKR